MPYTTEHKAETRARIVDSARRLFNRHGLEQVSIDEIMAGAGLTRGGFYNHFDTKDELYVEAVTAVLECEPGEKLEEAGIDPRAAPEVVARQIVNAYLSRQHLADIDAQCPMIALPSDVARGGPAVRRAYGNVFSAMVAMFESSFGPGRDDSRMRALAVAALCAGGMVLARAVDDEALAEEVREAARIFALELGGWEEGAAA